MDRIPLEQRAIPVFLARCPGYDRLAISAIIENMAAGLALPSSFAGKTVLLKPNLISATAPALACSDADFVAAVAGWFLDCGAKVRIGDSPAFGTAVRAMQQHGIADAVKGMNVDLIDFATPAERRLACGLAITVAGEALDCDLLVNLPRIKAHNQMYVTLSIKNIFGIVLGMRKAMLHMREGASHRRFADIILDLLDILPPSITFADGIVAMHREGPVGGEPLPLACVAGAVDMVALDTAILLLLELDSRCCPLSLAAAARRMPGADAADIVYPGLTPDAFTGSGFVAPTELNGIRFNPLRFLRGLLRRFALAISR